MKTILTTPRLLIRELDEKDWPDIYTMNSSPEVMRLIASGKIRSPEEEKAAFDRILGNYAKNNGLGIWAVTLQETETLIGAAGMTVPWAADPDIHIGYRFKKEYWGQGYATEVTKALVQYGFDRLGAGRLAATTNLNNDASRRVLEKAGLKLEKSGIFYDWEMNYFAIERPQTMPGLSEPALSSQSPL